MRRAGSLISNGPSNTGLVLDALATYRLTTLVKDDRVSESLRSAVYRRFGPPDVEPVGKLSYLLTCPWCLSMYVGGVTVAARRFLPRAWGPLSEMLAFSALTGLLSEGRQVAHDSQSEPEEEAAPETPRLVPGPTRGQDHG